MQRLILTFFIISSIFLSGSLFAQSADNIVGSWMNTDNQRKIEMQKATNGTYFAKVTWVAPTADNEYKVGTIVIKGLAYKDGAYSGGQALSPSNGGWVKCTAKMKDANSLAVTGYKYIFSKTKNYTRVK